MTRFLLLAALLLPVAASAQTYNFDKYLPDVAGDFDTAADRQSYYGDGHGVAVDNDGKIWLTPYFASDSVQVTDLSDEWKSTRVIYVFNADGTEAAMSPIKFLDYPDSSRDTLGGFVIRDATSGDKKWEGKSNRGLRASVDGETIYASSFDFIHAIDAATGDGLAKIRIEEYCSATQVATDTDGRVYTNSVCPGAPINIYDKDLNFLSTAVAASSDFSRSIQVSPDGLTLFETDFENPYTIVHTRPNTLTTSFDSVGVTFRGMRVESTDYHPTTGNLWVSSGNPLNKANENDDIVTTWETQTWYEFRPEDLFDGDGNVIADPVPVGSFKMQVDFVDLENGRGARPRGLDFSLDGNTAYIATFGNDSRSVSGDFQPGLQMLAAGPIATEDNPQLAGDLSQNQPNPFIGETTIRFALDAPSQVSLVVYDMTGRQVATLVDGQLPAGDHAEVFRPEGLANGIYVYRLTVDGQTSSRRMLIMR